MKEELKKEIEITIKALCSKISNHSTKRLLAIGFVTTDDVNVIGAKLLFEGDLPEDAEVYRKLSPVEWISSEEEVFENLNFLLASEKKLMQDSGFQYKDWVSNLFSLFSSSLINLNIRKKFGKDLFLTFSGVDPNDVLEEAEKNFVKSMNANVIFEQWCLEFD